MGEISTVEVGVLSLELNYSDYFSNAAFCLLCVSCHLCHNT